MYTYSLNMDKKKPVEVGTCLNMDKKKGVEVGTSLNMDKKKIVYRPYDNIKDVNEAKDLWTFAVRIADAWSIMGKFRQEHLDMVVIDKQVILLSNSLLIFTSYFYI